MKGPDAMRNLLIGTIHFLSFFFFRLFLRRPSRRWIFLAGTALLLATPASAHKVTVFAWIENDTLHTESKFGGGRPVVHGKIEVYDPQERRLLEGTTDDQGRLSFPVPQRSDLKVVMNAGMGHTNHWWVRIDEIASAEPDKLTGDLPAAPAKATLSTGGASDCLDAQSVRQIVSQVLETRLAPLEARLAEQRTSWRDVAGGIGFIVGLMGLVVLIRNRRNKGS
jgi:nickel transport protein